MNEKIDGDNEPYENQSTTPDKRSKSKRKSELSTQDESNKRKSRRIEKNQRDSELISWRDDYSTDNNQRNRSSNKETKKYSNPKPTENMADVKIRIKGFKNAKYDSSTYKSKPARY